LGYKNWVFSLWIPYEMYGWIFGELWMVEARNAVGWFIKSTDCNLCIEMETVLEIHVINGWGVSMVGFYLWKGQSVRITLNGKTMRALSLFR